ncbi:aminopeptidase P N-terminal domain-containing protein [uncultured Microscilla sp.]|uniref:aminopeptidase P N-terminal domain-containing protein n=1 Tax=uncultured Microscilla sp. TaxID=432653 RepID=UPI002612BC78|nr:aminopeptidase P N-terminal domain-containing protein [uncultured Microscilla sp.]
MNNLKSILLLLWVLYYAAGTAQAQSEPTDFLDKAFHKQRRDALRQLMPAKSVAVFFANPVRNRANDVEYVYHQDPEFYYLTGYREPHALLLIFKESQTNATGDKYNEVLFVQPKSAYMEMWTGRRLGIKGAKNKLGFAQVYNNDKFQDFSINFTQFNKVLHYRLPNDVRNGGLYRLIQQFKSKSKMQAGQAERPKNDPNNNLDTKTLHRFMSQLRETKTEEELILLKKAIFISAIAQKEVMKAMKPQMSESEVQGIHEYVFKKYGAEYEGYPSIVGAGHNGCVLHYITNNKPKLGNDLVLMDLGAEYHGYSADVTRTIPANGKFSKEQKAIYDLVYKAQEAGFKQCKVGNAFNDPHRAAVKIINKGLAELGIIGNATTRHRYFPHGTSHYLGLDVHDKGRYGKFKHNTVITVEPGIYIPEGSPCDKKWWGIAVRIEDDILITNKGWINLSAMAPRKSDEIEKTMAKKSPFDEIKLPDLNELIKKNK